MSTQTVSAATCNRSRLFTLSVMALATGGMVFSIRAAILLNLQQDFFEPISKIHAAELIGGAFAAYSLGLAIANFVGGPLCDFAGMGRLLVAASLLHITGTLGVIFAGPISGSMSIYWVMWGAMMGLGLAHGLIEAVINPLTATLYPEDKTHRLNVLHAWWPGGIIIGGLLAFGMHAIGLGWKIQQGVILIPAVAYGVLVLMTKFPPTERVAAGVSNKAMFREALRPLFIIWWLCMFLTAASELAPGTWVDAVLTRTTHMQGILLLVYVSGLMFVMRHFAGGLAHKLSPVGLMWFSSLLAGIGLIMLSFANSPLTGVLGATVWGVGVCYMWPTMLAVCSEWFPKGGALLLGLMGTAGNLSVYIVVGRMGWIFDVYKQKAAAAAHTTFDALSKAAADKLPGAQHNLTDVLIYASRFSFRYVAILPAVLLVVFGLVWLSTLAKGGYKAVRLTAAKPEPEPEAEKAKV